MSPGPTLFGPVGGFFRQLVRYLFSGGLAFVVDFALLYLFTDIFGLHYRIGTTAGYLAGLAITYILAVVWIFDQHRTERRWLEILGFAAIGLIGMAATHASMWFFTEKVFGADYYLVSKILATGIVSVLNFVLKKYILFTK